MKTLIILAHGSRRQESNDEIITLAKNVRLLADDDYDIVTHAYLEVVSPSLPEAIDETIAMGATEITVMPFFLNSGNHVKRDIPAMINEAKQKYLSCNFSTSACIGMHSDIPKMVLQLAKV